MSFLQVREERDQELEAARKTMAPKKKGPLNRTKLARATTMTVKANLMTLPDRTLNITRHPLSQRSPETLFIFTL